MRGSSHIRRRLAWLPALLLCACGGGGGGGGGASAEPIAVPVEFEEVGGLMGLPRIQAATASFGDLNGDGRPDLFVPGDTRHGSKVAVYWNRGDRFEEEELPSSETRPAIRWASSIADLDRDGDMDLLAAASAVELGGAETLEIWRNEGGTFSAPEVIYSHLDRASSTVTATLGVMDIDRDGLLDVYVARIGEQYRRTTPLADLENQILRNNGAGFDLVSGDYPAIRDGGRFSTYGYSFPSRVAFGGPPYLYLGNDGSRNFLFEAGAEFREIPLDETHTDVASMGVDHRYRNDTAELEIAVSDGGPPHTFRIDPGPKVVSTRSCWTWFGGERDGWGVLFGDFDNDGREDFLAATGAMVEFATGDPLPRNHLFFLRNEGRDADGCTVFDDRSESAGTFFDGGRFGDWYAIATADFDGDGCLDAVAAPGAFNEGPLPGLDIPYTAPVTLLRNRCRHEGAWVGFRLPDDVGAMVTVRAAGVTRYREVKGAPGAASRGDATALHFGLGSADAIEEAYITWSDGTRQDIDPPVSVRTWHRIARRGGP